VNVNDVNDVKEEIDEDLSGPLGGPPWETTRLTFPTTLKRTATFGRFSQRL